MTYRADLCRVDFSGRPHSLAGNLHKSELSERKHIMLGTVRLHQFLHVFEESISVLVALHVYEIHYHYSAHVPQPQLTGNLFCGIAVDIVCVLLLFLVLGPRPAVHVYDMQSLRMFYDQICALLDRDHFTERALYLPCNFKVVKNRSAVLVKPDNLLLFRRYERYVSLRFFIHRLVIHINI